MFYICGINNLNNMRKLTCKSTDNYGYEIESLDFYYGNTLVFRQSNHKLNRGGKTLYLIECSTNEQLLSSGRYISDSWHRKISAKLKEFNYEISEQEIKDAIIKRKKENLKVKLEDINRCQYLLKKEVGKEEKRVIHLRKQLKENTSLIKILQEQEKLLNQQT